MTAWEGLNPPYSTIVVDPPWRYRETKGIITRGHRGGSAEEHYTTMSNTEIAALPLGDLAAKDAHCYLWVTVPRLFELEPPPLQNVDRCDLFAVAIPKTMLTWVKTGPPGMGFYFRGNTEHVLFGVKGNLPITPEKRVSNVCSAPRGAHSEKPLSFISLVESVSPGPYVELFARQPCLGWDSWGFGYEGAA